MSQLQTNLTNLQSLLNQVNTLPFYVDTTDATAIAENLEAGYSAYVNGEKIEGSLPVLTELVPNEEFANVSGVPPIGQLLFNKDGVDSLNLFPWFKGIICGPNMEVDVSGSTSLKWDNLVIVNGEDILVSGITEISLAGSSIEVNISGENVLIALSPLGGKYAKYSVLNSGTDTEDPIYGAEISLPNLSIFGDATAADVLEGKTFTSADGLVVTGTLSSNFYSAASESGTFSHIVLSGSETVIMIPTQLDVITSFESAGRYTSNSITENIVIPQTKGSDQNFIIIEGYKYNIIPYDLKISGLSDTKYIVCKIPKIENGKDSTLSEWSYSATGFIKGEIK